MKFKQTFQKGQELVTLILGHKSVPQEIGAAAICSPLCCSARLPVMEETIETVKAAPPSSVMARLVPGKFAEERIFDNRNLVCYSSFCKNVSLSASSSRSLTHPFQQTCLKEDADHIDYISGKTSPSCYFLPSRIFVPWKCLDVL